MKITPLNDYVILLREAREDVRTAGGIIIPTTAGAKDATERYAVKCVSQYVQQVKEGECVVAPKAGTTHFTLDGEELEAISERNLICKIEEE